MSISMETLALAKKYTDEHGGGGTAGKDLGIGGATVGQIIKVKTVDADGKPTSWEAVDLGALGEKDNATANYTPGGSVSKPNVTISPTKQSITPMKAVGTLPQLSTEVSGKNVTIGFSQGTLPEKDTAVEVMTGASAELDATPSFTGTQATITVT